MPSDHDGKRRVSRVLPVVSDTSAYTLGEISSNAFIAHMRQ